MTIPTPTHQQLLDDRADLRAEFQYARRESNPEAMRQAFKDICEVDKMLREGTSVVKYQLI